MNKAAAARGALAVVGGIALLASVGLNWHVLQTDELEGRKLESGWDIQPLGAFVVIAGFAAAAAGLLGHTNGGPVGRVLGCAAGAALAARAWMLGADLVMDGQEDYATAAGKGYAVLLVGGLLVAAAAGVSGWQHLTRAADWRRAQAPHRTARRAGGRLRQSSARTAGSGGTAPAGSRCRKPPKSDSTVPRGR